MRLKYSKKNPISSLLGRRVRPKTIFNGTLAVRDKAYKEKFYEKIMSKDSDDYTLNTMLEMVFLKGYQDVFIDMNLGNLKTTPEKSYFAEIKTIVVRDRQEHKLIKVSDQAKALEIDKIFHGRMWIDSVHLEFYKGTTMEKAVCSLNKSFIMSYKIWELVDLDNILMFDSIKQKDFVKTTKSSGLVLNVKECKKPKFWKTNSLTGRTVKCLMTNSKGKQIKKNINLLSVKEIICL